MYWLCLLYWGPLNLQKNVNMLHVINKATSISCYFILSMYFIDNIRTFSANIKFICINFRNRGREKIVPLPSYSFLFWDECKYKKNVFISMYVMYATMFNLHTKSKNIGHSGWISESSVYSPVYARPVCLALRPTHDSDYVCV
jgi:hypothetical protein